MKPQNMVVNGLPCLSPEIVIRHQPIEPFCRLDSLIGILGSLCRRLPFCLRLNQILELGFRPVYHRLLVIQHLVSGRLADSVGHCRLVGASRPLGQQLPVFILRSP